LGGGALAYWVSVYWKSYPSFFSDESFATKDLDFVGSIDAAKACNEHWGCTLIQPRLEDHTPEIAIIEIAGNNTNHPIHIDFLYDVFGISADRISKARTELGGGLYILSELMMLTSRVANTIRSSSYRNEHAFSQLRQAISVNRAKSQAYIDAERYAEASSYANQILKLALHSRLGMALYVKYGIDVLNAYIPSYRYNTSFLEKGVPALIEKIWSKREALRVRQQP
jgi:hypothetical protein